MATEKTAVRLRINMAIDSGDGTMRNRARSFSNLALDATEEQYYTAATALSTLLKGNLSGVYKISEEKLTV